jgi:uncharacterized membrane protein
MDFSIENLSAFEGAVSHTIRAVATCIEIFGVLIIVAGIIWSTYRTARQSADDRDYDQYKIRIGRSLLLGLEVLVAADIIKTIERRSRPSSPSRASVSSPGWSWSAPS